MSEPRRQAATARLAVFVWLLALAVFAPAHAQLPPRLTAGAVAAQLDDASGRLAAQAALASTAQQLRTMAQSLRATLGARLDQPLTALDDRERGRVLRAHAAARLASDFIEAIGGCRESESNAMAQALASSIDHLARAPDESKPMQATIERVEAADHAAVFALHAAGTPVALALVGDELADPQCGDPRVQLTDAKGVPLRVQPRLTGVTPGRVELEWPADDALAPGTYLLHLRPQRKAFLVGCTAQPEAVVALQRVSPAQFTIDYVLQASCEGSASMVTLGSGRLATLAGYGATAAQAIDTSACAQPQGYRITATVAYADGTRAAVGPFEQNSDANLTVGLPGGVSLSWDPTVRRLFARSGQPRCKAVR